MRHTTAIKPEVNLHRFLPPLQEECASWVSPNNIQRRYNATYLHYLFLYFSS